ncbi:MULTISPECIES: TetR/AcrR family transcriptional regulator [unclassified Streptomyces]|uniref:TetR/AcrR family transcriptional regulator n=1 Tax=unclassified Streptomyces TaxID=2593676 RepID=UPI002E11AB7D|nr:MULTISPECIES: helix-turn-helix domain-containing protein [unclassified Streptomyces]WSJ37320.1 TetR/AcrR family transcriptional regulator [Streptomyces sp. NBC_01321]WSP63715.1 TetR/AcrR family transcriptional regulator [Streptomyces sp. NBC_01240]
MHIQDSHWQTAAAVTSHSSDGTGRNGAVGTVDTVGPVGAAPATGTGGTGATVGAGGAIAANGRSAPLRVDAQRNLEHVLRAAREVFGELGYGAPMEDVARRARVGVGTVYRRFPSKDVLVRRIAEEETSRLTDQARTALGQEDEPWSALSRFLRTSVASGAGRLLPPQVLRVGVDVDSAVDSTAAAAVSASGTAAASAVVEESGDVVASVPESGPGSVRDETWVPQQRQGTGHAGPRPDDERSAVETGLDDDGTGAGELLEVVGRLVERARAAGELRRDVTVADVLLVIATAAPSLPDAAQQAAASSRLLDILLEGLRSRGVA